MQLRTLLIALIALTLSAGAVTATEVTFQVYMSWQEELENFDAEAGDMVVVHGDFNEWSGVDHALELDDEGQNSLYLATFDFDEDSITFEYKFVIVHEEGDDDYEDMEDNRTVDVMGNAVVIEPVWFNDAEPVERSEVTANVYMSFQEELGNFDPETDMVVARGSFNGWAGASFELEMVEGGDNLLYSGSAMIAQGDHEYKFVIVPGEGDDNWENVDNRVIEVGEDPIELEAVWFGNVEPVETADVEVLFQVDMGVAIQIDVFDPANDAVLIRGGHEVIGNWGGFITLERVGASDIYAGWFQFDNLPIETAVEYKFAIDPGNDGEDPVTYEELPEGGNRSFTPMGDEVDEDQNDYGEIVQDEVFWANNPGGIEQDVTVHFMLDTYAAFAKFEDVGIEGVESIDGFWIAGLGETIGWDWGGLPDEAQLMDDGEGADEMADDGIYTVSIMFLEGTAINQIYKYGINMLDNEAGFGENHVLAIDDENAEMTVMDVFGSNGSLYDDYMSVRAVETPIVPSSLTLEQNFPNPFNPVTSIGFAIPAKSDVTLKVFNLAGQEVERLDAGTLQAGNYEITFEAHTLATGTYLYQIQAGEYKAVRKMTLIK